MITQILLNQLDSDNQRISYRKAWNKITGSVTATILLQQIYYWYRKNDFNPFYKFKEAPKKENALYDPAKCDDWCTELGFTVREFDGALKKIGFKYTNKTKDQQHDKFVEYWTDSRRVTYYKLNMVNFLTSLLDLYLNNNLSDSKTTKGDLAKLQNVIYQNYKSDFSKTTICGLHITDTTRDYTDTTQKEDLAPSGASSKKDQPKKKRKPARKSKAGTKKIVGKEKSLHSKAKERFNFWYEKFAPNSPPLYWDAKEIGQLTQMLNRLQDAARKKNVVWETDEDFIAKVFDVFCQKFIESKKWYSDCFSPSSIVSKWNIIIQTLQNEKSKSSSKSGQGVTDSYKAKILAALA